VHHSNHWYGHAHILARYCGLSGGRPSRIWGTVQHGWNHVHGFGFQHAVVEGFPRFVWSEAVLRRGWASGLRDYYVIGAPWAYLMAMEPDLLAQERSGTIWYPFHGFEHAALSGAHDRLIAEIRDTEPGPVTVCLYWMEYRSPEVRALYEKAGFRVICHGYRGRHWKDTEPEFLYRQLTELRRHRRVASNRLTTAIFYGVLAGCEPAVYGDPMQLAGVNPRYGDLGRVARMHPELVGVAPDPAAARAVAAEELGVDRLAGPAELRTLFNWKAPDE
jgi:hypothetical protein